MLILSHSCAVRLSECILEITQPSRRHSLPVEVASPEGVLDGVEGEVRVAHLLRHGADHLDLVPGRPNLAVERGRPVVP